MTKKLAHQQLRIMGIIGAIELDERGRFRQFPRLDAVFVQQIGKQRLADAGLAQHKHMHPVPWIQDGRLPLLDLMEKAGILLQEIIHVHDFRRFLRCRNLLGHLACAREKTYRSGFFFVATFFFIQLIQITRNIASVAFQSIGDFLGRYALLLLLVKHTQCLKHFFNPLQKSSPLGKRLHSNDNRTIL